MELTFAYSPCPNDTFMFHDVAAGAARLPDRAIRVELHDVETLNRLAADERFDVTKLSFHAYLRVRDRYQLLNVGAALGPGGGPVVVARRDIPPDKLPACRIAVPGELTTAHLLLRLWAPRADDRVFVRYDEVMDAVAQGRADVGVIIHEGRFVYAQAGLRKLVDLGEWWRERTDLPIPLGGIAARKALGAETIAQVEAVLRRAIENSFAHPEATTAYVRQHAREMDGGVLQEHIRTFVNEYSLDLGPAGRAAVARLEELALGAGILS